MRNNTKNMILAAMFAALAAVGAFLRIPLGFTAVTLQVMFTCLAGLLLGPEWGAVSQAVYVLLGLVGLPVFTEGGGPGYLVKPSMGFLFGLVLMAWVVGMLTRTSWSPLQVVLACIAGDLAMYAIAIPYMYLVLNACMGLGRSVWEVVWGGMIVFLPGDAVKIAAVTAVSAPLLRAVRRGSAQDRA